MLLSAKHWIRLGKWNKDIFTSNNVGILSLGCSALDEGKIYTNNYNATMQSKVKCEERLRQGIVNRV